VATTYIAVQGKIGKLGLIQDALTTNLTNCEHIYLNILFILFGGLIINTSTVNTIINVAGYVLLMG
jgi:hypothetical protein